VKDQTPVRIANFAGHQKRPAIAKLLQTLGVSTFSGQLADIIDRNRISESGFKVGFKVCFVKPHPDSSFLGVTVAISIQKNFVLFYSNRFPAPKGTTIRNADFLAFA
jgi:hypothetical protein